MRRRSCNVQCRRSRFTKCRCVCAGKRHGTEQPTRKQYALFRNEQGTLFTQEEKPKP